MKKFLIFWGPTIAWMGVIFYFSSRGQITSSAVDWQDFTLKKTAHFVEYFILSVLFYRSLRGTTNLQRKGLLFWTVVVCVIYAISDEIHQSFSPGRTPTMRDVIIDTIGSLAGGIASKFVPKKLQ